MLAARRALANPVGGPPVTASLRAWFDATRIVGISDGGTVNTWPDLTANHYDISCQGTKLYTTTAANLIGGKPTVSMNPGFGSTNDYPDEAPPWTIFIVAQLKRNTTTRGCLLGDHQSGDQGYAIYWPNPSAQYAMSNGDPEIAGGTVDTNAHQMTALFNGASSSIRIDSTSVVAGNPGSANKGVGLEIGIDVTTTYNYWGLVGEILIYKTAMGLTDTQSVEAYLKTKWATP